MKDRIIIAWRSITTSYWFVPSIMICGVWFLLNLMLRIDAHLTVESWLLSFSWITIGTIEGARQLLVSIVGSLITVIGLLFSMTMIVFTLSSSQYGPQVMRYFLGDRVTQIVLGTLVSTFIYCLIVLRSLGGGGKIAFIPHISITFALFLTVVSVCMLIYFIHHVCVCIQPQRIIRDLGNELNESMQRIFPNKLGEGGDKIDADVEKKKLVELFNKEGFPIYSKKGGYVQAIANKDMLNVTEEHHVKILLNVMPGDFVVEREKIALVYPKVQNEQKLSDYINEAIIIGSQRTTHQDIEFAIESIVAIAVRALSPGINEPFVSIMCIDYLSLALTHLSQRSVPSSIRYNQNDEICIVTNVLSFRNILEQMFDQILHYGSSNPIVCERIKNNLNEIKNQARFNEYQKNIKDYINQLPIDK